MLVSMCDPLEPKDRERRARDRHLAVSVDTGLWSEFRDALGHALRTTDLSRLGSFHRTHVGAVTAAENARTVELSANEFLASLDDAARVLSSGEAICASLPEFSRERERLQLARTTWLPILRGWVSGPRVTLRRSDWLSVKQKLELAPGEVARLSKLGAPVLLVLNYPTSLAYSLERLSAAAPDPVSFPAPGERTWLEKDKEASDGPPSALEAILTASDRCFDLCVGDWPLNLGIGGAYDLVARADAADGLIPSRAAYSQQSGLYFEFADQDVSYAHCGVASGDELTQFIENLNQPLDLRECWLRDEARTDGQSEAEWLAEQANDFEFRSFGDAEAHFSSRLEQFRGNCREVAAAGRTLIAWCDRAR